MGYRFLSERMSSRTQGAISVIALAIHLREKEHPCGVYVRGWKGGAEHMVDIGATPRPLIKLLLSERVAVAPLIL